MAGKGRPPKPAELKRKLGNPGKRKLEKPAAVLEPAPRGRVVAPGHLGERGLAFWARAWGEAVVWLSPQTDYDAVVMAAEMFDEREKLRRRPGGNKGADRIRLRELDKELRSLLAELGFTPAARTKLGLAEVRAQNALDELAERRRRRAN